MSHPAPQPRNGPWRLLILDRDPADPKWILAMVMDPGAARPAQLGPGGTVTGWEMVTAWVRGLLGRPPAPPKSRCTAPRYGAPARPEPALPCDLVTSRRRRRIHHSHHPPADSTEAGSARRRGPPAIHHLRADGQSQGSPGTF